MLIDKIGKYISYSPTSGSFTASSTYSGYSSDQTFSTDTSLSWRVLFVNESTLTLIADTTANSGFYLKGYQGYNNGVLLMNNACKAMYSNSSLGATARSIKIEDIEAVSSYSGADLDDYSLTTSTHYPTIFQYEEYAKINESNTGTLGRSEQTQYYTGYGTATTLEGKDTMYTYTLSTAYMSSIYLELFSYQAGTTTTLSNKYWLASRNTWCSSSGIQFYDIFLVNGCYLNYDYVATNGLINYYVCGNSLRPVVEISLSSVYVGTTGSGTSDSPYSITAK